MSKRDLKKYLETLKKKELETQIIELYNRFKEVKVYYDFVFNPKEDKLIDECKAKIANEYFPIKRKRPKARRSVAQKYIKHFMDLGVNPVMIADVMWFNLEIAQTFNKEKAVKQDAFYKSMAKSFDEAVKFTLVHGLIDEFKQRLLAVYQEAQIQEWPFLYTMERSLDMVD
ncbi:MULTISPECIES: DUF6155 family protein [Galbibacter]|uniref:DUF6155 family protein n=1 Tax=Galbibacter pacificus TaxID=2996052 RepID=A0ABT6FSD1_9FLAO|nr:DUF6155 family protein [Galbibacter pacificus]MDG3582730.1 DUF6155 family protein [Galbibacter pacificus]MDG3586151.1 DUF6155 family protein [Galbibacter pacificus]